MFGSYNYEVLGSYNYEVLGSYNYEVLMNNKNAEECYMILKDKIAT
ncbi:hypothetical protein FHG87_018031, partial [Trinorchestia longiramus]